jgi:cellulose synthase operon protein C
VTKMAVAKALPAGDARILESFARRIDPTDAGAQNNLGVLYFRRGLVAEATAAFSRALALDGRMRVALRNLEIAYAEAGLLDRRQRELEQRLIASPGDVGALVESAMAEKSAGNLDEAEAKLRRALMRDPHSPILHFFLAEIFYNRGHAEEALGILRRSIELDPESSDAYHLASFILGDLGRVNDARDANRRAISLNPRLSRAEANLSLDTPQSRQDLRAEADAAPAVRTNSAGNPHLTLAIALRLKGYNHEALKELRASLEAREDVPAALEAIAGLYLLLGEPQQALDAVDRLIEHRGMSARVMNQRGIALYLLGRSSDAQQTFRKCTIGPTTCAAAENNLGATLWDVGELREATNCFRRAARDDSTLDSAPLNLGLALFRQGYFKHALDAYRTVARKNPNHSLAWSGMARVLLETGKFAEARDAARRAISGDPMLARAHADLSAALAALGERDAAAQSARRALELDPLSQPRTMALEMDSREDRPPFLASIPAEPGDDYSLGRLYLSKGLYDRAVTEIRRAMMGGAVSQEGTVLLARSLAARGDYGLAEAELSRALAMGDADGMLTVEMAGVHRRMGRPADAILRVVGLLRANVYHFAALMVLGESLLDLKRTRDAARAFARVLRLNPGSPVAGKYRQIALLEGC